MDEWTNERKSPCVLQDIVPFGAAALLPLTHNQAKQGKGIADHILPMGDLFSCFSFSHNDTSSQAPNPIHELGIYFGNCELVSRFFSFAQNLSMIFEAFF